MSESPLLELRGLSKRFGRIDAVKDLDLTVRRGDVYGFLGLNGAGKTTTLRMVLGLIHPTRGEIRLFGEARRSERRAAMARIGALVEGPAFYPYLTGIENLLILGGLAGQVMKEHALSILAKVGLEDAVSQKAKTYSLGMKQRLGIALALVSKPEFVILDEPLNGLDPKGILEMRNLIRTLNREEGVTILVSSHLLHEIELSCNRVGIISKGRLVVEDGIEHLLGAMTSRIELQVAEREQALEVLSRVDFVTGAVATEDGTVLVDMPPARTGDLNRILVQSGIDVRRLGEQRMGLEEYFMRRSAEVA